MHSPLWGNFQCLSLGDLFQRNSLLAPSLILLLQSLHMFHKSCRVASGKWLSTVFWCTLFTTFPRLFRPLLPFLASRLLWFHSITSRSTSFSLLSVFFYKHLWKGWEKGENICHQQSWCEPHMICVLWLYWPAVIMLSCRSPDYYNVMFISSTILAQRPGFDSNIPSFPQITTNRCPFCCCSLVASSLSVAAHHSSHQHCVKMQKTIF